MKDKLISVRVNSKQLARLQKSLGVDESKTIRACMNCTENVIHNFFGGEVKLIFQRRKQDENKPQYD